MKGKRSKGEYTRLKRKVFFQLVLMFMAAFILFWFFYTELFFRRTASTIVWVIERMLFVDYGQALFIYEYYIRNNLDFLICLSIAVFFCVLFWFFLNWFVRYFRQIDRGLDMLLDERGKEIMLSKEMEAMERKLNLIRHTLEKRELEAKLSEQKKNELVMYLAHDIRTPLTSVIGYLSLLDEAPDIPETQREKYIHITLKKACRLETLVNEFFEITRYNFRQMEPDMEQVDLSYMLYQIADEFYPILSAGGRKAVLHVDEDMTIRADPSKLARVFQNILKNAAAYGDRDTDIVIEAKKSGENVYISFENEGKDIPKQKLNCIFERFYRLDDARGTEQGGAGLGLAIAKEIVLLHGGDISAESKEGRTVFTVRLPVSYGLQTSPPARIQTADTDRTDTA